MRYDKKYIYWGLTVFFVVCGILIFYNTVFLDGVLLTYFRKLTEILSPVLYGIFLAYILTPLVNWFEKILFPKRRFEKLARIITIALTWALTASSIYVLLRILLPQLYLSIVTLVNNTETYFNTIVAWGERFLEDNPSALNWLSDVAQDYYEDALNWAKNTLLPQAQSMLTSLTSGLVGSVVNIIGFLLDILVGVIVSVYLLATKETFAATASKMTYAFFSKERAELLIRAAKTVNRIFSGFFRGKLLDSLIIGILCFIFSSWFQFPYAPLVSVVVGVTNVIPYFGPFMGAIPSALLILLDSPVKCFYFAIFILALQQFDGNILGPKILGDSTGLSSFWVIAAILVGGGLWGVMGMFVGVPLFASIYTGIRYCAAQRLQKKNLPTHTHNYRTHKPLTDEELGLTPQKSTEEPDETSPDSK